MDLLIALAVEPRAGFLPAHLTRLLSSAAACAAPRRSAADSFMLGRALRAAVIRLLFPAVVVVIHAAAGRVC
jgi:hypothetical protein